MAGRSLHTAKDMRAARKEAEHLVSGSIVAFSTNVFVLEQRFVRKIAAAAETSSVPGLIIFTTFNLLTALFEEGSCRLRRRTAGSASGGFAMKSSFPSLDKKVPESKKYAHIGSSIDTGASAKKEKLHSANVMAKRKDEIFKRIRAGTLVRMLQDREVSESVYALGPGSEHGDRASASSVMASKAGPAAPPMSVASVGSVAGPRELVGPDEPNTCWYVWRMEWRAACAELHFEKSVLKHALSKHVHHFDYRDGMRAKSASARAGRPCPAQEPRRSPSPRMMEDALRDIYEEPPARPAKRWPVLLALERRPSIKAERPCSRCFRNFQRFMDKHVVLDSPALEDVHGHEWPFEDAATNQNPSESPRHEEASPSPVRTFTGTDPQEEAWMRWQFLQHMPDYLAMMLEQKEHLDFVSKAHQSQLLSARRTVMASDLAILLRVLPMFNGDPSDSSDIAEELAHVLGSEGQGRTQRRARTTNLPTVQRRASKLASLPTSTASGLGESLAMRRASVENMTDNIVEAIRQASGKAKGGRTANTVSKGPNGRPSNKGRRQSLGQERPRHSTAQSFFEARRNSSAQGFEAPGDENRDSPESFEAVSLETLLDVVPAATKTRWGDILNLADADLEISKPRFVSKIAHAMRQKPQWFILHESIGEMSAELVEPQPLDSPLPPSAEDVPHSCHCWLGSLMVLHRLPEIAEKLSGTWQFQISAERLQHVAASLERAESLALCGGFALTLDVCRAQATDLLSPLRPLPGSEALSPAWLKRVFETKDEEANPHELGDDLRLLAQCLALQAAGANFEQDIDSPLLEFSQKAWRHFCRTYLGEQPGASDAAFAEATNHLIPETSFKHGEVFYRPMLGALTLELLLQKEVAQRVRSNTEKVDNSDLHWRVAIIESSMQDYLPELMWQVMGWNTPAGRRVLRRCSFAFFQMTAETKNEMTRKGFLRLCHEAGWDSKFRSKSASDAFFGSIFDDAVFGISADLLNFLQILKMTAELIVLPDRGCCGIFAALQGVADDLTEVLRTLEPQGNRANTAPAAKYIQARERRSVVSVVETDTTVSEARDLVLLDVREGDEFDQCHLPLAVSYPAPKINRDQFIPELLRCKRDPGKLLVVYGANEQATIGVAKLLVEKGWENVHALSGGFEEMIQSYPEVLEGTVPDRPLTTSTTRSAPRR
ncbi:Centrosomal protein of 41 kDa A [Symbiodinium microadriaticum]|uniref:Centrosomal protein of 41 kDa A n=1 Tax=Symbiodinium microadriaticum TaxID=2951 RepID=A0A1Q9CR38_SYMMI|nr:Centrosomal protein of 41 kDa A [Symbiodinium microadriaticum]